MGKLIGSSNSENFGEKFFITKAQEYLDDSCVIYWNRQVFGREFDVCILLPGKGVLVVELKGWRENNILRVNNNETIVINTTDGEVNASPMKQARGYRFSIERHIRQSIGKNPLVFNMVCLPQVSKQFYRAKRLDVVTEERFTFLAEDLESNKAFFGKLDQALREVLKWRRDPFDHRTMLEVRNLFETDSDLDDANNDDTSMTPPLYHLHDYSRFIYISKSNSLSSSEVDELVEQYMLGCKIYGVFHDRDTIVRTVSAIDAALTKKGLVRSRENIEITFDDNQKHNPACNDIGQSFMGFHCALSIISSDVDPSIPSFTIHNGVYTSEQKKFMLSLASSSQFNAEQFFVEHANPEKNIIIRAGAGTGKTYTMISRISYVCYSQNVPLQKMADRIIMITFTNEAADQMENKLKTYFRNCYLVTSRSEYLSMVSRIDHMQISTIHSYAKKLIAQLGTSFGYGIDVGITSSEFYRKKKISDILDAYINKKKQEYGPNFTDSLGMPIYAIRDSVLDFISKLHNKSVDVTSIEASDFGSLADGNARTELHELFEAVIPAVEKEYFSELLENNRIHLSSMMSILNRFIAAPESKERIKELKKDKNALQFMFVDEFQDTDDSQIESLLTIAQLLDYRMFLVGDIKQCIYRFRGAKEKAFDQLHVEENPADWLEFSLQRNYRTDSSLLDLFDLSFSNWGGRPDELLTYSASKDRLIGTQHYNNYLAVNHNKYFKKLTAASDEMRIPLLIGEIKRIQARIKYEEEHEIASTPKERSIAILVRENWQAEMVRAECNRADKSLSIQTNTGGDLYTSQPALDMMTLINALLHFDEAEYLYNLVTSNFFNIDIPKSNLYEIRMKIRTGGWRAQADEHEQVNYLIHYMNLLLANTVSKENRWEYIVASLRTKPVLQVVRQIYGTLEPWKNYSTDAWKQHYYQLNVDLLFEQLINTCNVDKLTINTLQEQLYNSIVSKVSVDSRTPASDSKESPIQCITVHKSKGLEYGHVIMPFCSAAIDFIKRSQLHLSAEKSGDRYNIGYSLSINDTSETIQNDFYNESIEKSEKSREEARILYVAMTRAIRSFSWIEIESKQSLSWQQLIIEEN